MTPPLVMITILNSVCWGRAHEMKTLDTDNISFKNNGRRNGKRNAFNKNKVLDNLKLSQVDIFWVSKICSVCKKRI